ncbi:MAG: aminotransferase class V-fold PLP-dependent enzyme, partial [Alphaproteobacteria bacterium]
MNELPVRHAALAAFDVESVRREFPIFTAARPHDRRLAFLDSAASAQKPAAVIARIARFYETEYANIHRGIYTLSAQATESFEAVRDQVRHFLAAPAREEIIFTRGTTESINLVARCFARAFMRRGDAILLTEIEHHSNIVPWQMVAQEYGLEIRVARVD